MVERVFRGGFRVGFVNDEYIRSTDNAAGNNAGLTATANAVQNNTTNFNARFDSLPTLTPPAFIPIPRTFADNNTNAFAGRFGTVSGIDPNLQVQRVFEYNFGIQREIGFQTALEVRYVGAFSNQLVRSIDYNQIDIRGNGFVADFNRAVANERATRVTNANGTVTAGNIFGNTACLASGACQPLTVIPNLATGGQGTVQNTVALGTPADTALTLIQNGTTGTVRFLPNPNSGVVNLTTNAGKMRYNALQAELRRRFAQGSLLPGELHVPEDSDQRGR